MARGSFAAAQGHGKLFYLHNIIECFISSPMLSEDLKKIWKQEAKNILDRTPGKCPVSKVALTLTLKNVLKNIHVSDEDFLRPEVVAELRDVLLLIDKTGSSINQRCVRGLNAALNRFVDTPAMIFEEMCAA